MAQDLLIGLDAGTSVIKVVAFDPDGVEVGIASTPNRIKSTADGGVEQDMAWTWEATAATFRALAEKIPNLAARTAAVAITGQGDGTWLIDRAGEPVAPAWLWLDARSAEIVRRTRQSPAGRALSEITGTSMNPSHQSGHLLWLRENRPELLARAATAFHCKDWLYFKATGELATDPAEAIFTFGDYRSLRYDDRVLELLDLSDLRRLLPPIVDGARHHGRLQPDAARVTGLAAGTPIVLAPLDVPCTVLGAGGYAPGRSVGCSILGSTGMHSRMFMSLDEVEAQHEAGYVMAFPVDGVRAGMMSHMAATLNIDWLLQLVASAQALDGRAATSPRELLALLEPRIAAARPGAALFHPFIADNGERGPFVEPAARAQLSGLSTSVGLDDIARAVFEGLAFAGRDCYRALGGLPDEVRITGGAAKSAAMRTILASVLDRPLRISQRDEAGAAGAAIVAAVSIGRYPNVDAAIPGWVDARLAQTTIAPDPALARTYAALFPIYRASYAALPAIWHQLADFRKVQ